MPSNKRETSESEPGVGLWVIESAEKPVWRPSRPQKFWTEPFGLWLICSPDNVSVALLYFLRVDGNFWLNKISAVVQKISVCLQLQLIKTFEYTSRPPPTHTFHIKLMIITTGNTSITLSSGSWLQDKHKLMWACQI